MNTMLEATMTLLQPKRRVKHSATDSTRFDTHYVSRYFIWRTGELQEVWQADGPDPLCHPPRADSVASAGPTPDIDQLEGLMAAVPQSVTIERLVADARFDWASNHRLLREEHGIVSTIPPRHGRPSEDPAKLPSDPYRRLMKTQLLPFAHDDVRTVLDAGEVLGICNRLAGHRQRGDA